MNSQFQRCWTNHSFKELQAEDAMLAGDQKTQLPSGSENEESELPPPPSAKFCQDSSASQCSSLERRLSFQNSNTRVVSILRRVASSNLSVGNNPSFTQTPGALTPNLKLCNFGSGLALDDSSIIFGLLDFALPLVPAVLPKELSQGKLAGLWGNLFSVVCV